MWGKAMNEVKDAAPAIPDPEREGPDEVRGVFGKFLVFFPFPNSCPSNVSCYRCGFPTIRPNRLRVGAVGFVGTFLYSRFFQLTFRSSFSADRPSSLIKGVSQLVSIVGSRGSNRTGFPIRLPRGLRGLSLVASVRVYDQLVRRGSLNSLYGHRNSPCALTLSTKGPKWFPLARLKGVNRFRNPIRVPLVLVSASPRRAGVEHSSREGRALRNSIVHHHVMLVCGNRFSNGFVRARPYSIFSSRGSFSLYEVRIFNRRKGRYKFATSINSRGNDRLTFFCLGKHTFWSLIFAVEGTCVLCLRNESFFFHVLYVDRRVFLASLER